MYNLLEDGHINDITINRFALSLLQKKIDSMFSWACTETHWRGHQNMVRSSVTHSAASAEPRFFSYHILMSSVIYY